MLVCTVFPLVKKTYLLMQHYFECSRSKQLATALKRSSRPTGDRHLLLYSLVHIVNNKRIDFVVRVLTGDYS